MPRRILKLVIGLLIVSVVSYVFYLNPHAAPVNYSPSGTVSPPLALTLITVFCAGATLTAFLAFLFDMEYLLRLWKLGRREKQQESHQSLIVSAREFLSAGMLQSARERLSRIVQKDPKYTLARIQLAETFLHENNPKEALRIIEEARALDRSNLELLFLAAEVNRELGNVTAAYDNYQLVLRREPKSPRALHGVVSCCKTLGRYEEAIRSQIFLLKTAKGTEQTQLQEELADIEVRALSQRFQNIAHPEGAAVVASPESRKAYRKAIEEILVRHRDFSPALRLLAAEDREALRLDPAAKLLARSFRASRSAQDLELLAGLWLQADEPAKAIAAVKILVEEDEAKHAKDKAQLEARLFFIALLLFLENIDEAKTQRKKLDEVTTESLDLGFSMRIIDSWLNYRKGEVSHAFLELFESLSEDRRLPGYGIFSTKGENGDASRRASWAQRLRSQRAIEWRPTPELSSS